jgi:hypothetical protein
MAALIFDAIAIVMMPCNLLRRWNCIKHDLTLA